MDNQRNAPGRPIQDQSTQTGLPASASARQVARNKGLALVSAITFGTGAAGLVGAVVIGMTLPSSTAAASMSTTASALNSSASTTSSQQLAAGKSAALQAAAAPTTTIKAPVATSGAS